MAGRRESVGLALSSKAIFSNLLSLCVYSISHFVVDFSCAFLFFRLCALNAIPLDKTAIACVVYNSLAFGLEFLIGAFFNARTARLSSVLGGLILIGALVLARGVLESVVVKEGVLYASSNVVDSLGLTGKVGKLEFYSLLSCALAGIGNAFFHVGGGIDSLTRNYGKYSRSGVFISTGALGLALGGFYGRNLSDGAISFELAILALCLCSACVWMCCGFPVFESNVDAESRKGTETSESFVLHSETGDLPWRPVQRGAFWIVFALLFVIFSRSAVGFLAPQVWSAKTTLTFSGIAIAFAAFLGKFAGGFCADLVGPRALGFTAIASSIPFLCLCSSPELFWTGVVLLNMSTAVTLTAVAQNCGKQIGFAFGLTTLALLAGYFVYDWLDGMLARCDCIEIMTQVLAGSLIVSAIAVAVFAKRVRQSERKRN